MTRHSEARLDERCHMQKQAFLTAYRTAIKNKNFLVANDVRGNNRAVVLFSDNHSFLHKVIISKTDGAIITYLPIRGSDFELAIHEGIISKTREYKRDSK